MTRVKTESASVPMLVSTYKDIATAKNESVFGFVSMTSGYSVRQIQDSIKQAKKESGISLPELTPTKAQHFATLNALVAQFPDIESEITFSKAYAIAEKSDRAHGATKARELIAQAEDLEDYADSLPKTVRGANPPAGGANPPAGDKAQALTADNIGDLILALADTLDADKRARLVTTLVAVSKAIQLTPAPTPKKSRKAKVTA
jgi:hypothetical protein